MMNWFPLVYNTDQVLYWSIHQYPAFPGNGTVDEIGAGKGTGFNINVPLPPDSGDDIFMDAVQSILPIAEQFKPDVVAVSAGFDGHLHDLLLQLRLTADSFYRIGELLGQRFGRTFAVLEGGYNVGELPKCLYNFVAGYHQEQMRFIEKPTESNIKVWSEYEIRLNSLLGLLKNYWSV